MALGPPKTHGKNAGKLIPTLWVSYALTENTYVTVTLGMIPSKHQNLTFLTLSTRFPIRIETPRIGSWVGFLMGVLGHIQHNNS